MDINTILLVAAALAPAFALCVYLFKKDRVEKEPMGLLMKLFVFGALSSLPVLICEILMSKFINATFVNLFGLGVMDRFVNYLYVAADVFIGVALVEEGFKWLTLVWLTKQNKAFNCFFDGMVYAIFVSLGFAALENVLYVLNNGWANAVSRAILSVPGHMFFAVMMGYYYSRWNILEKAHKAEKWFASKGYIKIRQGGFNYKKSKKLSLFVPILFHGTYNFCCMVGESWAIIAFLAVVVFMYVHCFKRIKETSNSDATNEEYITTIVLRKYPELPEIIKAREEVTEIN